MLLTISGPAGSGKSTVATGLAQELGYEHVSGGDIFRDIADDRGLTPLELNKLAETDEQIDRDLDKRLRELAITGEDLILESRLAGWMAGDYASFRIWLDAPLDVRVMRIADREGKERLTAERETIERTQSEAQRYEEYYHIDIHDLSIYDLAVNTGRLSPDGVLAVILTLLDAYDPEYDEGATPVEQVTYEF